MKSPEAVVQAVVELIRATVAADSEPFHYGTDAASERWIAAKAALTAALDEEGARDG